MVRTIRNDEKLYGYLQDNEIQWQFNLSCTPWWGGQFERLISIVKSSMSKTIGGATLNWQELQSEVLLDIETQINNISWQIYLWTEKIYLWTEKIYL